MRWSFALLVLTTGCRISFEPFLATDAAMSSDATDATGIDTAPMMMTLTFGERTTSMFQNVTSDSLLDAGTPTLNYGGYDMTSVYAPGGEERGIVRFDLTATPSGSRVMTAALQLVIAPNGDEAAGTLEAHVVTESWTEGTSAGTAGPGATWLSRDGTTDWATAGGTTSITIGSIGLAATAGPADIALSPLTVQAWIDSPATNAGLLLRTAGGHWHPFTREAADRTTRPQLVLEVEVGD